MGMDSGAGLVSPAMVDRDMEPVEARLKRLIQALIDPDGWKETQGESTLEFIDGMAVVVATEERLNQVEDFLDDLMYEIGR